MENESNLYGIPFKIPLKVSSFFVLFAGVLINLLGKYCSMHIGAFHGADGYVMPGFLWLDTIGTFFSAAILGPIAGAAVGLLSNLLNVVQDSTAFFYAFVSVAIGVFVGCLYPRQKLTFGSLAFVSLTTVFVVVLLCGPLNIMFYNGEPGTYLGDKFFTALNGTGVPRILGAILAEASVDVPDKILSMTFATGLFLGYKKIAKK